MERFETSVNRKGTSSVKWDLTKTLFGEEEVLPMWVADMDFLPPQEVIDSLKTRLEHGIFGYTFAGESTAEAVKGWMKKRHGWEIHTKWLTYSPGVVPAIATAIQALTDPGDKVLVQSPVYTPFFSMVEENDRVIENCQLVYENGHYSIDFTAFERSLASGVKLFLLCNPHNPGGRVWTKEELTQIGELCHKHDVFILSDEIHSDLVYQPHVHISLASIDEKFAQRTITCVAPSKTFNLAGLQASAMIIPNVKIREKIAKVHKQQGFFSLSTFGICGMEAAYNHGEEWLENMLAYLKENINIVNEFTTEQLPSVKVVDPHGTYLIWLDCKALGLDDEELKKALLQKGKLALEPGTKYGAGGEGFVRMNIACPRSTLLEGLERLKIALS